MENQLHYLGELLAIVETAENILAKNNSPINGPRFEIRTRNGKDIIYYPHLSFMSWKSTGAPVSLAPLQKNYAPREFRHAPATSPLSPLSKSTKLKTVKISLGMACNYSCSYCSQSSFRIKEKPVGFDQVEKLITSLDHIITTDRDEEITFELWGGEPLVYWQNFKKITTLIRERFPAAKFKTVTNGTLLDSEKIAFLAENKFAIGLSHDGPGYHLRGRDPLENPKQLQYFKELLQTIPSVSFNCVLTEQNYSLRDIYFHLRERLGMDFYLSTEGLVSIFAGGSKEHAPQGEDHNRKIWRRIREDLLSRLPDGTPLLHRLSTSITDFQRFQRSLMESRPAHSLGQKCGMDREDNISLDLQGRVTTCQNVTADKDHGIGNIDNYEDIRLTTAKHWSHHANCRNCPVVQLCQGSCMYLMDEARRPTCDGHFTYFLGTLAAIIQDLTGEEIVSIHSDRVRLAGLNEVVF